MARPFGEAAEDQKRRTALWIALVANGVFALVEVAGGIAFKSLALLADSVHMLSDVAALGIALIALALSRRPSTSKHSFGLERAEVLAAQANGLLLIVAATWILIEAVHRLSHPKPIAGIGMLAVASGGLAINVGSALVIARASGKSLNMRGALLHLAADSAASVAAITAAVVYLIWHYPLVDPIASIFIGLLITWSAFRLLWEAAHVLLEGTPRGIDADAVAEAIESDPAIDAVHHLHIWAIASDEPALSAHVLLAGELSLHQAQDEAARLRQMLRERFGIGHATLELECHVCEEEGVHK